MHDPDVKEALASAVKALYFGDGSDYGTALWEVVAALGGFEATELVEEDGEKAYEKYCEGE